MPRKEKKGSASKAVASTKPKSPSVIEEGFDMKQTSQKLANIRISEKKKRMFWLNKYESLRNYQSLLTLLISIVQIGGVLLLVGVLIFFNRDAPSLERFISSILSFFALTLIGIGIWVLLQTKKMIDFLFDLAEEKADISHKH